MRVAMTVEQLWQPVPGGSGTYIRRLAEHLPGQGVTPVGVAARSAGDPVDGPAPLTVRHSRLPRPALYEAWHRLRRPRAELRDERVVHATTWAIPGHRAPLVVTVHDLAFLRDPGHFTPRGNAFFRRGLELTRHEAARVVVPSAITAEDCVSHGIEADRIDVIPHGVRIPDLTTAEVAAWRSRNGLHRDYLLWCGALEPRKNLPLLLEAYREVLGDPATADLDLVLIGPVGWGDASAQVRQALDGLPEGRVHVLGRVGERELHLGYAGARVFVFPSLWEGFGMPALEAMAHGVPVVTSAGTSMAEFVDDGGLLVDPTDRDGLAAAVVTAAGSPEIGTRGRAIAARLGWDECARRHADAYRVAAGD